MATSIQIYAIKSGNGENCSFAKIDVNSLKTFAKCRWNYWIQTSQTGDQPNILMVSILWKKHIRERHASFTYWNLNQFSNQNTFLHTKSLFLALHLIKKSSFLFKSKLLHLEHIILWPMKTHVPHVREAVGSNLGTVYWMCRWHFFKWVCC